MAGDRLLIFLAIAHHLLRGCVRPVILVDWTQSGGSHEALVAAVPIGGRALPIYLEVHPLPQLGNAAVERRFLCALKTILPTECRSIIVSDAGFKGPFFRAVLEFGWDFLGRVRGTTKAISPDGKTISKEAFYARASTSAADLGAFGLFAHLLKLALRCRALVLRLVVQRALFLRRALARRATVAGARRSRLFLPLPLAGEGRDEGTPCERQRSPCGAYFFFGVGTGSPSGGGAADFFAFALPFGFSPPSAFGFSPAFGFSVASPAPLALPFAPAALRPCPWPRCRDRAPG